MIVAGRGRGGCLRLAAGLSRSYCGEASRQRNIGILAHVDAGKTTTTERLLFYSGEIDVKGEVHRGNTVTDYLAQERDRGISITSAFVKFNWNKHVINLVDTPGHIDFTAEVENAMGVIDSAVLLLDSSAGVEAQTYTVWSQIRDHRLPCLVYVNKMDRADADFEMCLDSLRGKLGCEPLGVQLPLRGAGGDFIGVVDLPSMDRLLWSKGDFSRSRLSSEDAAFETAEARRLELVDKLTSLSDELADSVLGRGSLEETPEAEIVKAVRAATVSRLAVPVVCGSSYKDVAVQSLLDAVVDFLPSPLESPLSPSTLTRGELLIKSFKVVHDRRRGPVTYLRLHSGELAKGQKVFNASKEATEQVGKILVPFADDFEEIQSARGGQFVAVTGLRVTHPGEVLCGSGSSLRRIQSKVKGEDGERALALRPRSIQPVFFCSVEASSHAHQQALDKALSELEREDSSLKVTNDEETGQTVLSGMGELHLDIVRDRLRTQYKLDVDIGPVQIMYKEKMTSRATASHHLVNTVGAHKYEVLVRLSLGPAETPKLLTLDNSSESAANLAHVTPKHLNAVERGLLSALRRGPLMGYPVIETSAVLHWLECKRYVPDQLVTAAAAHAAQQILDSEHFTMLEPFMTVNAVVPDERSSAVLSDLSRRRANILNVEAKGDSRAITAQVPTAELVGYSSTLRTITSGKATLLMTFSDNRPMSAAQVDKMRNFGLNFGSVS